MKALVIDDAPDVVEVVRLCLELRWPGSVVIAATTGAEGLLKIQEENPDVIILDIGLPDMDGYEVCKQIRTFSNVPIVMLTVRDRDVDITRGLELGADDYVTKPFSHIELLARVNAVLRRAGSTAEAAQTPILQLDRLQIDFNTREVLVDGHKVRLTPIEYDILYQLATNAGRVVTHQILLSQVWGPQYADAADYLKVHIQHLRQKLGDSADNPKMIVTKHGVGYRFMKPGQ